MREAGSVRSARRWSAPLRSATARPSAAVDPATHTIYVANGFNANGQPGGGDTVSVIDGRHCQADDVSRCKGPWPTITVGTDPNADPSGSRSTRQTDTLYVSGLGDNTVAVFNGATCNAR